MKLNTQTISLFFLDIRFWILLLFIIRLENIDLPPLDVHAYRQCLTLGVARNYLEIDWNLFAPRTILCDSRPGFEVMEFPILNYTIALLWRVFGEHDWCFRLLGITVASLGLWHFHGIARRYVDARSALAGTVLFGTSIAFIYARKAMPDVFSLSLVLIGVNIGLDYLEKGKSWRLALVALITAAGLLSKIPSATALAFLVVPFFDPSNLLERKIKLTGALAVAIAAMSAWYFVWIPWAEKAYDHAWFFRLGLSRAWHEAFDEAWVYTKERFYPIALQSRLAFFACVSGLVWMFIKKQWKLAACWAISSVVFFYFILQVGKVFSGHEYYIIPYTPIMGLLAGYGLGSLVSNNWLFIGLLALMAAEAVYRQKPDFFIPWQDQKFMKLQTLVDTYTRPKAKILTSDASPRMIYFAHRSGWTENKKERLLDKNWLDGESTVGLEYAVIERCRFMDSLQYPMIFEDNDFRIYKIKNN